MSKMSLLDKLGVLFDVTKSSYWFLIVLAVLAIIGIFIIKTNKKNSHINKIAYAVFGITAVSLVLLSFNKSLSKIFDYMMNNLFIAIYFPNLAIYFAAILITNVIVWISIFNYKTSEIIKRLNIIIYVIMNYLLFLILTIVNKEKLDVFSQNSIYNNKEVTALIELSSIVFMVWVAFLILYKIILTYIRKDYKPKVKRVLVKKEVKKLPDNYEPVEVPILVYGNISHKVKVQEEKDYKEIEAPIIVFGNISRKVKLSEEKEREIKKTPKVYENIEVPEFIKGKTSYKEEIKLYEDMLTLDDYKRILQILKNKKTKQRKQKEIVDDKVKERQQIRLLKEQEDAKEEAKLTELENLYRSIR